MTQQNIFSCPLTDVALGATVRIVTINGDFGEVKRLREMGFVDDSYLVKTAQQGALICQVGSTSVVLSEALARNIIVNPITTPQDKAMTLDQLKVGQRAKIKNFLSHEDSVWTLQEMGVLPGEEIKFLRTAPLGDPIEISIRGASLSLRRSDAKNILIEVLL